MLQLLLHTNDYNSSFYWWPDGSFRQNFLHYIDLGLGSNFCTNNYSYFPFYLITNYSASKRSYYTSKRCYYCNVHLLWLSILNLTEHYLIRQTFGVQKFVMSINVLWLNNDPIHDELFR